MVAETVVAKAVGGGSGSLTWSGDGGVESRRY